MRSRTESFNSRSREGSDRHVHTHQARASEFQFTLPRGERRIVAHLCVLGFRSFNSRSREGSDVIYTSMHKIWRVSIHAPARGATGITYAGDRPKSVSIHAPARGATDREEGQAHTQAVSIHAPARGATRLDSVTQQVLEFQFTLPRGERLSRQKYN